jgi:hypothetical protein
VSGATREPVGPPAPPPEPEDAAGGRRGRAGAPVRDLFATAVHRFGEAWADLVVAAVAALGIASAPVVAVHEGGGSTAEAVVTGVFAYAIAYFTLLGFVMLRGLPERAPRRRVVWTYATAVMAGTLAGMLILLLQTFAVVALPLLLFAVPSIAAGDALPGGAVVRSAALVVRNFTRTYLVWLIIILFAGPIVLAMLLVVNAFASSTTSFLAGLGLAAPVVWPFSALFVRALYGDLTGRPVVAPADRTG